jgi:hypothetical protein
LIGQGAESPLLVCTDREPVLAAREYVSTPLALILPPETQTAAPQSENTPAVASDKLFRLDAAHHGPRLLTFQLGRNRLALPEHADDDRRLIAERFTDLSDSFDLAEPFQRIRDAIEEAQQAVR